MSNQLPILVAASEEPLRQFVRHVLTQYNYTTIVVGTVDEAKSILHTKPVSCLVITADLAVPKEKDMEGVIASIPNKMPTVTLVGNHDWDRLNYLYDPTNRIHEHCTLPCEGAELVAWIRKAIASASTSER